MERVRRKLVAKWIGEDSSGRELRIPSPVQIDSDNDDFVAKPKKAKSGPRTMRRRSPSPPEPGTGGLNSTESEDDSEDDERCDEDDELDDEQDDEEAEEEEEEEDEEEEETDDFKDSDFRPGDGGFPGDTPKHRKPRMFKSPVSGSTASTSKRLNWEFVKYVDLTQKKADSNAQIEKEMKKQMAIAGNPMFTTKQQSENTFGGWKQHRVCFILYSSLQFLFCVLLLQSDQEFVFKQKTERLNSTAIVYYCPFSYTCGCKVQMKLVYTDTNCAIRMHLSHDADSHKVHRGK